ncbi:MAG: hypothetical protein OCD76_24340 [Reichenbachiella sp.]
MIKLLSNYKMVLLMVSWIISSCLFLPCQLLAQENEEVSEEERKSELSVFLGGTSKARNSALTIGVDYQYRLNQHVGIGGLVDYAAGDLQSLLIGPAFFLHIMHLEATFAPSVEINEEGMIGAFRSGVKYEFEISKYTLSPGVYYDTERKESPAWIYGLAFGFRYKQKINQYR